MITLIKRVTDKNKLRIAGQKAGEEFGMEFIGVCKPLKNYPYYADFGGDVRGNYVRLACECGETSIHVVFDSGQLILCPNCNEVHEAPENFDE